MNLANSRAILGLTTKATPTSTAVNGSVQIGNNPQTLTFPDADVAYSIRAFFAEGNPELDLELTTGVTTGSTAFIYGAAQVETATAAGTASASGNVTTTVTSAGMAGSPLAITTAILNGDTAATWAGKVRTTLAANTVIASRFTVSGTSTSIVLTRKPGDTLTDDNETINLFLATDSTLNIALTGPAGVTAAPTSANTVVGTVTSGVLIRDGDGLDFEGVTIPTIDVYGALFVNSASGTLQVSSDADLTDMPIAGNSSVLFASANSNQIFTSDSTLTITGSSTILTITVLGEDNS